LDSVLAQMLIILALGFPGSVESHTITLRSLLRPMLLGFVRGVGLWDIAFCPDARLGVTTMSTMFLAVTARVVLIVR